MKSLFRPHYAIGGSVTDAELMINPENKELVFCAYFARHGYESLSFDSSTDIILFLNSKYSRKHFININVNGNDEICYLDDQTIYSQYYATIKD